MDILLLSVLIFINFRIIYFIIMGKLSAFSPISIFTLTVVTQMFPQIAVLYNNNYYNNSIIPSVLVVMILWQLAFEIGYRRNSKVKLLKRVKDFNYSRVIYLVGLFTILGLSTIPFYKNLNTVYGGINVILGHLRNLGIFGLIIAIMVYDKLKSKYKYWLIILILLNSFQMFFFAYFVKGSREIMFALVYILCYYVSSEFFPKYKKSFSRGFFFCFFVGSIISGSITEIRRVNNYKEAGATSLEEIDFKQNYVNSIVNREILHGMDLGNAAILIDEVRKAGAYDFGTEFWNGFIYSFFPSRFFGDEIKKYIYITTFDNNYIEGLEIKLTDGITTKSGYYIMTFKSFSFLGFIVFYFIGFLIGSFERKGKYSSYYHFILLSFIIVIPTTITHTPQYFFGRAELIFLFLSPVFYIFLQSKRLNN